ncbi:MAG: arylesterase [Rhodospirillales bacterium]|nr:arylesterase [Rhodospirillales bacterium]
MGADMAQRTWERKRRIASVQGFTAVVCTLALTMLPATTAQAEPIRILALGDSLTAGYGLQAEDGFTAQLEQALREAGHDVVVLDAGVSGDTTAGGLARIDWALAEGADAAIVELGANDALRGIDPASSRANLDGILVTLGERGIPVLLAGMYAPRNLGPDYVEAFDGMYPDLAETHHAILYPFFLEGVAAQPALNQPDGIHPNAEGVALIVEGILPDVVALLERVQGQP